MAEVAEIQAFVADLPDRDTRTADKILGYDGTKDDFSATDVEVAEY